MSSCRAAKYKVQQRRKYASWFTRRSAVLHEPSCVDQNFVPGAGRLFVPSLAPSILSSSEYDGRDSCHMEKPKTNNSSSGNRLRESRCRTQSESDCAKLTASRTLLGGFKALSWSRVAFSFLCFILAVVSLWTFEPYVRRYMKKCFKQDSYSNKKVSKAEKNWQGCVPKCTEYAS